MVNFHLHQLEGFLDSPEFTRVKFIDLTVKYLPAFTVIDQLHKKFGTGLIHMNKEQVVEQIKLETEIVVAISKLVLKKKRL